MKCVTTLSPTNLPWLQYSADSQFSHRPALRTAQGGVVSWGQVAEKINLTAGFLQHKGVTRGNLVAFCGKNSEKGLFLYLATIALGAKVVGINPAFPADKIELLCSELAVDFCFSEADIDECALIEPLPNFSSAEPATLTLTSGSSGMPKAAVHNVSAHLANALGVCELMNFTADSSWLFSLPLYHVSGQGIVWRWLSVGSELVFPQTDFYQTLNSVTHASLVPTQVQRWLAYLVQHPQKPQTKAVLLGGSRIPLELGNQLAHWGVIAFNGYGLTEMASTVCAKVFNGKEGVGLPLSGRHLKLVGDEIYLSGASMALGYWQRGEIVPLANAEGFFPTKDKGAWLDNEWHCLGRIDNMFISGGENIQPEEIEQLILQWPEVKQAFVLPQNDSEFGQRPVALLEFVDDYSESAVTRLRDFLQGRLERFKQPIAYYPLPQFNDGAIKFSRSRLADWMAQQGKSAK